MKVINSKVTICPQEPGVIGMKKHIELAGRVAYKSESKITDDSYIKFLDMLHSRGHWAVFSLGTVYLGIPRQENQEVIESLKSTAPYTKWTDTPDVIMVTTNYRVICQLGIQNILEKYWTEPTPQHHHRVTSHWICDRGTAQQLLRHRVFCPVMESTRYCNYSKSKFSGELTYILPQWIYRVRADVGYTVDPKTYLPRDYVLSLDGQELWDALCCYDRTVSARDDFWRAAEAQYIFETTTDESERLKAEEARGSLPLSVKTELFMTGYVEDWMYTNPDPESPEKAGFFQLRCAKDAQADIKVLADSLLGQFESAGLVKLK